MTIASTVRLDLGAAWQQPHHQYHPNCTHLLRCSAYYYCWADAACCSCSFSCLRRCAFWYTSTAPAPMYVSPAAETSIIADTTARCAKSMARSASGISCGWDALAHGTGTAPPAEGWESRAWKCLVRHRQGFSTQLFMNFLLLYSGVRALQCELELGGSLTYVPVWRGLGR